MEELAIHNLVNQYIDDEKKRNDKMRSKSAIYKWINGDVNDEIIAINDEFKRILNKGDKNERKIFTDSINAQFKTSYFQDFLLNKSKPTEDHYKKLLKKCIIHKETIEVFLWGDGDTHEKTIDFFRAFCKNQEREYGKKESIYIPQTKNPAIPNEIKTETLEISGATIINKEFVAKIKEDSYTPEQFYTAMYNDASQWYGVISNYDIPRNVMSKKTELKIESILESFFSESRQVTQKVSLIVNGTGGSGKTTLLRKWAVNFCDESKFRVLWITSFEQFLKGGFDTIQQKSDTNFLVIINDWDHLVLEDPNTTVRKFLNQTSEVNNFRLIIGDRTSNGKIYEDYLIDRNAVFEIDTSENKKIIHEISQKCPQWKRTIEQLSENSTSYESSLYLLLFIIARLNDDEIKYTEKKPADLFIGIIKSDLKIISDEYNGLAKALYYWGCAYAKYKVSISYDTFLEIAHNYQKDVNIKGRFDTLNRNTITHKKLRGLISVNDGLLKFHHDVLADVGINQVALKDLGEFDDIAKLDLLDIITDLENDHSASSFLVNIVEYDEQLFSQEEILKYVEKLINKGNCEEEYMIFLMDYLSGKKLKVLVDFARKLANNNVYSYIFWNLYLVNTDADEYLLLKPKLSFLLDENQIPKQHFLFTNLLLKFFPQELPVKEFISNTLKNLNWTTTDYSIIESCLSRSRDEKLKQEFIEKVLGDHRWKRTNDFRLAIRCLEYISDDAKKIFLEKVMLDDDFMAIKLFYEQYKKYSPKSVIGTLVSKPIKIRKFRK